MKGFWEIYYPAVTSFLVRDLETFEWYATLLFPKLSKCDFYYYGKKIVSNSKKTFFVLPLNSSLTWLKFSGASGSIQNKDLLCLLPVNVINQKVFLLVFIWYIFLCGLFCLNVIYKLFIILFSGFRIHEVRAMLPPSISHKSVRNLTKKGQFGIWFFFISLNRNLEEFTFGEIFTKDKELNSLREYEAEF